MSYKWRIERLHIEKGVYFSRELSPIFSNWKDAFLNGWDKKNLWNLQSISNVDDPKEDQFQISVSARFKPKGISLYTPSSIRKIDLPLHQRLAIIRMNRNITSQKEAFQILTQQGAWNCGFNNDAIESHNNEYSTRLGSMSITGGVHSVDIQKNYAILVDNMKGLRKFEFDHVLPDTSTQANVYKTTTMPLVADFINGIDVTCIVYGQTGSGKTYTMFGQHTSAYMFREGLSNDCGILPRACCEIFEAIKYRTDHVKLNLTSEVYISYVEIYGNKVSDLLKAGAICGKNSASSQRHVYDGSSEVPVHSLEEVFRLLKLGDQQKRKAATAMNTHSSRAHTVFIIKLKQSQKNTGVNCTSHFLFADLGGSEQIKKSQPLGFNQEENSFNAKARVREAVHINLGLLALKQCVESLRCKRHVPYGNSKLTLILSKGLGGKSKTSIIICGAQEECHGKETIAACKFGQICRGVTTTVSKNINMIESLLQTINNDIFECEKKIRENERWETVEVNEYDDKGAILNVKMNTIISGAENYRLELANLIRRKNELTGEVFNHTSSVEGFGNAYLYDMGAKVRVSSS
jgi:kinesin family protein 5